MWDGPWVGVGEDMDGPGVGVGEDMDGPGVGVGEDRQGSLGTGAETGTHHMFTRRSCSYGGNFP